MASDAGMKPGPGKQSPFLLYFPLHEGVLGETRCLHGAAPPDFTELGPRTLSNPLSFGQKKIKSLIKSRRSFTSLPLAWEIWATERCSGGQGGDGEFFCPPSPRLELHPGLGNEKKNQTKKPPTPSPLRRQRHNMVGERVWLIKINIVCMAGAWQAPLTRRGKGLGVWMLQIRIAMVTQAGSRILHPKPSLRGVRGAAPKPPPQLPQGLPPRPAESRAKQGWGGEKRQNSGFCHLFFFFELGVFPRVFPSRAKPSFLFFNSIFLFGRGGRFYRRQWIPPWLNHLQPFAGGICPHRRFKRKGIEVSAPAGGGGDQPSSLSPLPSYPSWASSPVGFPHPAPLGCSLPPWKLPSEDPKWI